MIPMTELEEKIAWSFHDLSLLEEALTHSSYVKEHDPLAKNYERLEFLGDAVLGLLAADMFFRDVKCQNEGQLTSRRARLVCWQSLGRLASSLELEKYMRFGESQRLLLVNNQHILADAFEAIMAAVYLDAGFEQVKKSFLALLQGLSDEQEDLVDFKSALQELCHTLALPAPSYEIVQRQGPPHASIFHSQVQIDKAVFGPFAASSKKAAQQQCAAAALDSLLVLQRKNQEDKNNFLNEDQEEGQ